jgi:hypothetical protein
MSLSTGAVAIRTADDARETLALWRSHPKLFSWLLLRSVELPSLAGIIISRWDQAVADRVATFAGELGADALLLRSDSPAETGHAPRGGFVLRLSDVPRVVPRWLGGGRTVFLLEPASPFDDRYSLSLEPLLGWREWCAEVVGAGFDASDLKRGDVTPHEQVRLSVEGNRIMIRDRRIASDTVQASVRAIRAGKIASMLKCSESDIDVELTRRGETMFLEKGPYRAVPDALLSTAVTQARRLRPALQRWDVGDHGIAISMSFVGRSARPVFWDLVWPRSKYVVDEARSET